MEIRHTLVIDSESIKNGFDYDYEVEHDNKSDSENVSQSE